MSATGEPALRVALIGCGRIGAHTPDRFRQTAPLGWIPVNHAEAIRSTPGLELVAVCDAREEQARETATELGVASSFTDYRELISTVRPDIVSIATRTAGRCDIVEFAARNGVRGLHVEKPLGRSMAECERALRAVETAGAFLSYGTTRRCMDVFRSARSIVESGELGHLQQITIELGRAALLWSHPHSFDVMIFFSSGRKAMSAQATCHVDPGAWQSPVLDADPLVESAFVQFADGLNGVITCAPGLNVRLACEGGQLTIGADGGWLTKETKIHPDRPYFGAPERMEFQVTGSGTQRAFLELADAIRGRGQPSITADEILLSNQLAFVCAWSSLHEGRHMSLTDLPKDFTITGRQGENYS